MLQEEFGNNIGFHERIHKDKSIIVYNKADCGTFIDATLHSFGRSHEQLICNVDSFMISTDIRTIWNGLLMFHN